MSDWPSDRRLAFNRLIEAGISRDEAVAISWKIANAAKAIREAKS